MIAICKTHHIRSDDCKPHHIRADGGKTHHIRADDCKPHHIRADDCKPHHIRADDCKLRRLELIPGYIIAPELMFESLISLECATVYFITYESMLACITFCNLSIVATTCSTPADEGQLPRRNARYTRTRKHNNLLLSLLW